MSILAPIDFKEGDFAISYDTEQKEDLQQSINVVERKYLPILLGVSLFNIFNSEYPNLTPRLEKIFNPFITQDEISGKITNSIGMKEMLKAFTYFHYVRELNAVQTPVGMKETESANSENRSLFANGIVAKYNIGVETFKAIQYFIVNDKEFEYNEYKGQELEYNHPF